MRVIEKHFLKALVLAFLPFFEGSGLAFTLEISGSVILLTSAVYATLKKHCIVFRMPFIVCGMPYLSLRELVLLFQQEL